MRNFTSFVIALLITFSASAQTKLLSEKAKQSKNLLNKTELAEVVLLHQQFADNNLPDTWGFHLKNAAATHKLDSTISWEKEPDAEWEYTWKEELYYNQSLRNDLWIDKEWDATTESWYVSSQTDIEFESDGSVKTIYSWYREQPGAELLLESKMEPRYKSSGKLDSLLYYASEDGETWTLEMKQVYTYNSSEKIARVSYLTLEEGEMIESTWTIYTYDDDDNLVSMETYFLVEGEEFLLSKTTMEYNSSGQLINEIDWTLSYTTFQLEKSSRIATHYNASGDVETEIWYDYNDADDTWIETEKDEHIYGSLNYSDVIYPSLVFLYDYLAIDMPFAESKATSEIHSYTKIDDNWVETEKTLFHYSAAQPSNANRIEVGKFEVFPNPVSENVTFSWTDKQPQLMLELYRTNGTKIMERQIFSGKPVEIKNFDSGIYLYRLTHENETIFTGKLVKQ
jgi:hypothetical protein